jgi:hypothetical protein
MSQTETKSEQQERFAQQLLDSYFLFRRPLPEDGFIQENKTTLQIMDELLPMMAVSTETVVGYMTEHDYSTTTEQDGTVSWAIWRQVG